MFEKFANVFLAICSAGTLFCLCFVFYNYIFHGTEGDRFVAYLMVTFLGIGLVIAWFTRHHPHFLVSLMLFVLLIVGLVSIRKFINSSALENNTLSYQWPEEKNTITLPFQVGKSGRILLEAQINDTNGLFMFDTGAGLCTLNELVPPDSIFQHDFTMTDASGLLQRKKLRLMDHFQLGDIQATNVVFWPADTGAWNQGGIHAGVNNILGIIGNNFLTHFVWDFDLRNNQVTIAKSIDGLANVDNTTTLALKKTEGKWKIPVMINGDERKIELDFGFAGAISLNDFIPKQKNMQHGTEYGKKASLFSHTLSGQEAVDISHFIVSKNVELGDQEFTKVKVYEKKFAELIGIQFIWAFERVILDYPNQQIILSKKDQSHELAVKEYSVNDFLNALIKNSGGFHVTKRMPFIVQKTLMITDENDTVEAEYQIYGKAKFWGKDVNSLDSIEIMESVRLPNGDSVKAPYIIDVRKKFFVDQ